MIGPSTAPSASIGVAVAVPTLWCGLPGAGAGPVALHVTVSPISRVATGQVMSPRTLSVTLRRDSLVLPVLMTSNS